VAVGAFLAGVGLGGGRSGLAQLPALGPLRRIRGMPLTTKVRSGRPGPCLLAARHRSDSGKVYERANRRPGDIKIVGASGDAVCGGVTALTRWVPAGQAVRSPASSSAHRASGCAEEFAANGGDPREPHHRRRPGRPGSAAMTAAHRARECYTRCVPRLARLRLFAGDGAGGLLPPGAAGEVSQAAGAIVAETGAAGQAAVAAVAEGRRGSAAVFLAARQARLAAAADEVVAAAADGSAAMLSRPPP